MTERATSLIGRLRTVASRRRLSVLDVAGLGLITTGAFHFADVAGWLTAGVSCLVAGWLAEQPQPKADQP